MKHRIALVVVLVIAVVVAALAFAADPVPRSDVHLLGGDGFTIPAAWAGIWESTNSTRNCDPDTLISMQTNTDTLCTGDVFYPGGSFYTDCTTNVTDTSYSWDCTLMQQLFEGCVANYHFTSSGTRTGDTWHSEGMVTITYEGTGFGCDQIPDNCIRFITDQTRIGPAPASCGVPVEEATWGMIKSLFE